MIGSYSFHAIMDRTGCIDFHVTEYFRPHGCGPSDRSPDRPKSGSPRTQTGSFTVRRRFFFVTEKLILLKPYFCGAMGKKKLQRFEAIRSFTNVLEYPEGMPGRWKIFSRMKIQSPWNWHAVRVNIPSDYQRFTQTEILSCGFEGSSGLFRCDALSQE